MVKSRKFLAILLSIVCCICCAFLFTACGKDDNKNTNGSNNSDVSTDDGSDNLADKDILAVYNTYVAYSQENGNTPLSYEEWLLSIKGDKGDTGAQGIQGEKGDKGDTGLGIKSAVIDSNGDLIITFDDDTFINAGNVVNKSDRLNEDNKIVFNTLTVSDDTVYGKVSNETEVFYFTKEIALLGNASYIVYTDIQGQNAIPTKTVNLSVGDNTFYILESCGNDSRFYTVTIRRRPIYTVTFATVGAYSIEPQYIEEDSLATIPVLDRDGYGWTFNYDFNNPIIKDTTITATETAIFTLSENEIIALTEYGKTLTELIIPAKIDGVDITSIGGAAFYNCSSLTEVIISNSVTSIGSYSFYGCMSLTSIKYRGTKEQWDAISKETNWSLYTGNYTITYDYTGE